MIISIIYKTYLLIRKNKLICNCSVSGYENLCFQLQYGNSLEWAHTRAKKPIDTKSGGFLGLRNWKFTIVLKLVQAKVIKHILAVSFLNSSFNMIICDVNYIMNFSSDENNKNTPWFVRSCQFFFSLQPLCDLTFLFAIKSCFLTN